MRVLARGEVRRLHNLHNVIHSVLSCNGIASYQALQPHRFRALRCLHRGRKTEFAKAWVAQGLVEGQECTWLAPQHMMWSEVFSDLMRMLGPIVMVGSRSDGVIRFLTGGCLDFYSLEKPIVGRGKRYQRMVIDEAALRLPSCASPRAMASSSASSEP